jgi:outer membrane receptor protein involved in Fe transport
VYDAQTGRTITGVVIAVDGAVDLSNVTDSSGHFTIKASPGKHALHFTAENYRDVDIREVEVTAGQVIEASTVMSNQRVVESIEVVEKLDSMTSTAEALLAERKLAAVVSDSVSHQELSQQAAGDAAGALTKVTGVTVGDEGHVFVRGLGERYSATALNGAMIPTTEPEKRVVPLDLFPSSMIDTIKIAKTYAADLPAEFSGGLVQLQTTEYPSRPMLNVSIKGGFNSATTFNPFLTYPGSSNDFWGFGADSRGIPSAIPRDKRVTIGGFDAQQLQTLGQSFSNVWEPTPLTSQRPALDWGINGGSTFGKFGVVAALTFSNKPQYQKEVQRYLRQGGDAPIIFTEYPDFREYSEAARLGGVFNLAFRPSPNQRFTFRNTLTHDTEKTAREFAGYDGTLGSPVASQRLRFIARDVFSTGIDAEHVMPNWHNSVFHWQFTYSLSGRDEPDLREVFRTVDDNGVAHFAATSGSATRFFSFMNDRIYEPQADYSVPFYSGTISGLFKAGVRATIRRRDFQARRFRFIPPRLTTLNTLLPSNQLLGATNIRPDGFQLIEYTRGTDAYDASMNIYAGYAQVDLSLGPKWRIVAGFRMEDAAQEVVTIDNQIPTATPVIASLQNRDPIPSVNLIYAMTLRQNIRVSYSRTVSRPDFRELSPFDFNNVLGGFVTVGNANLRRAAINNYDVRWEMFLAGNQLIAASAFVKTFKDPIEQTVIVSNDLRQSFINAKGARNYGFELEFRYNLETLSQAFREFSLSSNFTFVDSNIEIRPEDAQLLTTRIRPLLGQARYVFNGTLQWARSRWHSDARLMANYVSSKISDLGTYGVPDIYQQPNTTLDFVYQYQVGERGQWSYRFEAENLTNNDFHWTQGSFTQREYRLGRTFQIGLTYSFF